MNSTSYRVKTFRKKNVSIQNMCIFPLLDFILYIIQYNDHLDIYIPLETLNDVEMVYIIWEGCLYCM